MATKQVDIPQIGTVTLYKRRGNRSLRLSVGADGEIRVSIPSWVPYKAGEEFARAKADWIVAHRKPPAAGLQHGQSVGKAHHLQFTPSALATRVSTRLATRQSKRPRKTPHCAPCAKKPTICCRNACNSWPCKPALTTAVWASKTSKAAGAAAAPSKK
jgi:hypothetical protein